MKLTNDVCRCHDSGCPECEDCLRWLCRSDEGAYNHSQSLFPYDRSLCDPCPSFIGKDEE